MVERIPEVFCFALEGIFRSPAHAGNDFCYEYLPRINGNHSHMDTIADMADGKVKGYFVMGENPTVGSMNGSLQRAGLRQLDWLVVRDFVLIETAEFWRSAPEIESGDVRSEDIATEVFFFPPHATRKKTVHSRIRNGCCSGMTKLWRLRATVAANCISCFTSDAGSSSCMRLRLRSAIVRSGI